jgi:hypothetical protein
LSKNNFSTTVPEKNCARVIWKKRRKEFEICLFGHDFWLYFCYSQDVTTENEFEKKLLGEVIPSSEIGVNFEDIGALEKVKETLKELVMLPLQRPELFRKGQLMKVECPFLFLIIA